MRRSELVAIGGLAAAVVVAAIAGSQVAPDETLADQRRSVNLHGPDGASALREALDLMGVPVREWNSALFDLEAGLEETDAWVALLDLAYFPSRPELEQLIGYVERGGRLLVVGWSGVEHCFGYEVEWLDEAQLGDGVPMLVPPGVEVLPHATSALRRLERDTTRERPEIFGAAPACEAPAAMDTIPLLRTTTGRYVAVRLQYESGGAVVLVAEGDLVSNEALRDTDAGPVVMQWLLADGARPIVFDEYHQGFGEGGSLFGAAWRWLLSAPAGWTFLQVAAAGLLALWVVALRFGPALHVVERERRSALEHVDALAVGLARAGADRTAIELMVEGLRRRLRRGGTGVRRDWERWLTTLELAARTPEAQQGVRRLVQLMHEPGGSDSVLEAATAVEDVWNSLGRVNGSKRYSTR